jgi:hypothetical protein
MRLWTIQHIDVWNKLQKKGLYKTDKRFICFEDFKEAYEWMVDEAKRINPEWKESRPVWFWTKKPDLRTYRFVRIPGKPKTIPHVLIEIEVDPKELLITDFDMWHQVLNSSYVPKNSKDYDRFYNKLPRKYHYVSHKLLPEKFQKEMLKSWSRIVKSEKASKKVSCQAIKEDLKMSEVKKVKFFNFQNLWKKSKS